MTTTLGNAPRYALSALRPFRIYERCSFTIGSAGAVSASDVPDPGFTLANGGTGIFNFVFPKCVAANYIVMLESPAGTVKTYWGSTALDAGAGTASFTTGNGGGTATNPASGDKIGIFFFGRTQ